MSALPEGWPPPERPLAKRLPPNSVSVIHLRAVRFTWDSAKASTNVRKHGVTFEEAATVFADPLALIIEDVVQGEDRELIIGESARRALLVTVFIERDAEETRILSARRATRHERRRYEEGQDP